MWIYCEELVWSTGASTVTCRRFHSKQGCLEWFGYNLIPDERRPLTRSALHRILHQHRSQTPLQHQQDDGHIIQGRRTIYFFFAGKRTARQKNLQPPAAAPRKLQQARALLH